MYYLQLISLEDCPYSEAAESLLKDNNINHKLVLVNRNEKDKFKTDNISTFPQIYLKKENSNGSVLIGGYDLLKEYYDSSKNTKNLDKLKKVIKKNTSGISEKSVLRFIQLII